MFTRSSRAAAPAENTATQKKIESPVMTRDHPTPSDLRTYQRAAALLASRLDIAAWSEFDMALAHPDLKLIYISGFSDDAAEDLGPVPPDAAILQKPFQLDTLLAKIRFVLDNKPSVR